MRPAVLSCWLLVAACGDTAVEVTEAARAADEHVEETSVPKPEEPLDLGDGLLCEDLEPGHGPAATVGSEVTLHYSSYLAEQWESESEPVAFDSSASRHVPLTLRLGSGAGVVEGLARGLVGLRAGSETVLHVPSELGWGEQGNPAAGVPADADLVFEIRVLSVK